MSKVVKGRSIRTLPTDRPGRLTRSIGRSLGSDRKMGTGILGTGYFNLGTRKRVGTEIFGDWLS